MGLFVLPLIFLGFVYARRLSVVPATSGMALIMAGNLIYLIPNTALNPIGIVMFGALAGFSLSRPDAFTLSRPGDAAVVDTPVRTSRYTRFAPGSSEVPVRRNRGQSPQRPWVSRP